jgi:hypothetical protein
MWINETVSWTSIIVLDLWEIVDKTPLAHAHFRQFCLAMGVWMLQWGMQSAAGSAESQMRGCIARQVLHESLAWSILQTSLYIGRLPALGSNDLKSMLAGKTEGDARLNWEVINDEKE